MRRIQTTWWGVLLVCVCRWSWPVLAVDPPELSGFYKNLVSATTVADSLENLGITQDDVTLEDAQRIRLKLDADLGESVEVRIHYELLHTWGDRERIRNELEAASGIALPLFIPARVRYLDLESEIDQGSNWRLVHGLDRLQVRWVAERVEVTVGRQPVSWGAGLIWTPSDLFSGFSPTEIDRDEKIGVDVFRLTASPTLDTTLDLVVEPLDESGPYHMSWEDSSLALRVGGHIGEYDVTALGGQIAGDEVLGGDFSGYLLDAGFRGEWVYTHVKEEGERDYVRALLSLDYGFAAKWNPYLAVEYFYNGLGTEDPDQYLQRLAAASVQRAYQRGNTFNLGRQYLGTVFRLMPSALVVLQSVTLFNLDDGSLQEYVSASRSLSENIDLMVGATVGVGEVGTEFGGFSADQAGVELKNSDLLFAFLKVYF